MKKPWRYHGECCASGCPAAKTQGACGPSGFGLGTSLGTTFTMIPPRLFQIMSHYIGLGQRILLELNPNILVRDEERMCSVAYLFSVHGKVCSREFSMQGYSVQYSVLGAVNSALQ